MVNIGLEILDRGPELIIGLFCSRRFTFLILGDKKLGDLVGDFWDEARIRAGDADVDYIRLVELGHADRKHTGVGIDPRVFLRREINLGLFFRIDGRIADYRQSVGRLGGFLPAREQRAKTGEDTAILVG